MPCPIRHRSRCEHPARRMFETMVGREYLEARLARLSGRGSALLEHTADRAAGTAEYTLRQTVNRELLPSAIQKVLGGDLQIERTELWRPTPGGYGGTVDARMLGAPARISGTQRLVDLPDAGDGRPGSELEVDGAATVPLPLVGAKIETAIAEQVERIIDRETQFTREWVGR